MIEVVQQHKGNILRGSILPNITWQAGMMQDETIKRRVAV
jgi:hypothetical protein